MWKNKDNNAQRQVHVYTHIKTLITSGNLPDVAHETNSITLC